MGPRAPIRFQKRIGMSIEKLVELVESQEGSEIIKNASSFSQAYTSWICSKKSSGSDRAPGIHASEISGCPRRLVYSIMGTTRKPEPLDAVWHRRFNTGHAIHQMLQKEFHQMAQSSGGRIGFVDEVTITPERQEVAKQWVIRSSCDGLFTVTEKDGKSWRMLLEIKTASPMEFEKLRRPKLEHIEQAHVYMACLGVPVTWMLYWNKGNQNITGTNNPEFLVKFDKTIWSGLEQRFQQAHTDAFKKNLPDRQESIACEFCAFSYTCNPKYLKRRKGPTR